MREQIKVQNVDIAAVVETWAHAGIGDAELALGDLSHTELIEKNNVEVESSCMLRTP